MEPCSLGRASVKSSGRAERAQKKQPWPGGVNAVLGAWFKEMINAGSGFGSVPLGAYVQHRAVKPAQKEGLAGDIEDFFQPAHNGVG